jgi:LPS export ABC transporter protein LptC
MEAPRERGCARRSGWRASVSAAFAAGFALAPLASAEPSAPAEPEERDPLAALPGELHISGMTFVGSRGDVEQFVLNARRAVVRPDANTTELEGVRVTGNEAGPGGESFELSFARGELDVETSDFRAEGDVRGSTGDGRRYQAPWVRYDHARSLLYSDAPVTLSDATGTFRGDGFRYSLEERSFRLVGNVRVVQAP